MAVAILSVRIVGTPVCVTLGRAFQAVGFIGFDREVQQWASGTDDSGWRRLQPKFPDRKPALAETREKDAAGPILW